MASVKQTAMRLDDETKQIIDRISGQLGISQTAVVEASVRNFERTLHTRENFLLFMAAMMHDLGHLPHTEVTNLAGALQTIASHIGGIVPGNHDLMLDDLKGNGGKKQDTINIKT